MTDHLTRDWIIFVEPQGSVVSSFQAAVKLAQDLGWLFLDADHLASDELPPFLGRTGLVIYTQYPPDRSAEAGRVVVLREHGAAGLVQAVFNLEGKLEKAMLSVPGADLAASFRAAANIVAALAPSSAVKS